MNPTWLAFLQTQGAVVEGGQVRHFGDPAAERVAAAEASVLLELSALALIRVRGTDAQTFLNGQLSNDVRRVDETHSQIAAWCDPKGRALALVRVLRRGEDYCLLLPVSLQDAVLTRLRMFVLRAKVTLESAAADLVAFGLAGPQAETLLRDNLGDPPAQPDDVTHNGVGVTRISDKPTRFLLIAPAGTAMELWSRLRAGARPVAADRWTWFDIAAGLPQIYSETSGAFVPQMFNLELLGGVDFRKGCYPGQEIVARLHYRGGLKQRMVRAHVQADATPGMPVYAPALPGQSAGAVVSAAAAPAGGMDLLAVIQIGALDAGDLRLGDARDGALLQRLPLPYSLPTTTREPG